MALDDGDGPDECPPAALLERLAFRIDLHDAKPVAAMQGGEDFGDAGTPQTPDAVLATLVATAAANRARVKNAPTTAGSGTSSPRTRTPSGTRKGRSSSGSRIRRRTTASWAAVSAMRTPKL